MLRYESSVRKFTKMNKSSFLIQNDWIAAKGGTENLLVRKIKATHQEIQ